MYFFAEETYIIHY